MLAAGVGKDCRNRGAAWREGYPRARGSWSVRCETRLVPSDLFLGDGGSAMGWGCWREMADMSRTSLKKGSLRQPRAIMKQIDQVRGAVSSSAPSRFPPVVRHDVAAGSGLEPSAGTRLELSGTRHGGREACARLPHLTYSRPARACISHPEHVHLPNQGIVDMSCLGVDVAPSP